MFAFFSPPTDLRHDGVDPARGYRIFSSVCSLLGDVFCHLVLGSDHLSVYCLPHWSSQQDAKGPLDCPGNTNTHRWQTYFFYEDFSALSASGHSAFLCLRVHISSLLGSLCLLVAVFELWRYDPVSGDGSSRRSLSQPGY